MAIRIYNTLSKKKEIFRPIKKGKVGMYVCGPTVYDEPHIGHLRCAYVFELIRRYFIYRGYKIKFVKNITDIDDKIIDKAKEELKSQAQDLKEKVKEVAERYLKKYRLAMQAFGISSADVEPSATGHIRDMQDLIKGLIKKGFAYQINGNVYFSVRKFPSYGKLSHQKIEELYSGARIEAGEDKKDALDFALWKKAKAGEPSWPSPWGEGRPGWHIECSAMSMKYLSKNFDIHGGGRDLIFPHHENEIAQSEAFSGKDFANYWIHNGLLTIDGEKMAKSLGNFISVEEILKKFHPEVLKIFFLSAHYSHPVDFSWQKMEEAKRARERFYILLDKIEGLNFKSKIKNSKIKSRQYPKQINEFRKKFIEAMDDDFNTPRALGVLFDLVSFTHKNFTDKDIIRDVKFLIMELGKIFCLFEDFGKEVKLPMGLDSATISRLIEERNKLRKAKNFAAADKIREDLRKIGVILEDAGDRTTWRYKF